MEKMSSSEKKRRKFIESENYPRKCPECGCDLTPTVWKPESKYEDIVKWMTKTEPDESGNTVGGLCPAPDCHAPIVCPRCGKVRGVNERACGHCGYNYESRTVRRTCNRCRFVYDREVASCPKCGLPSALSCEQCGAPMHYGLQYCSRGHFNDWDKKYPRRDIPREEPRPVSPLNGSFVITPYGPMFVFDPTPAPKPQPQPQPQPMPVVLPEPEPIVLKDEEPVLAPVEKETKKDPRAGIGVLFAILSILCAVAFPVAYAYFNLIAGIVIAAVSVVFALIGIGLGTSGRAAHPKTGAAAIVLGFIGILVCAAICVWVFLYNGLPTIKGWLKIKK